MYCCTLLYVHSSIAIILMGKRELVALLNLSSWCLVMVEWLFAMPRDCLRFVIVVFPDHTHLLFFLYSAQVCCQASPKLFSFGRKIVLYIRAGEKLTLQIQRWPPIECYSYDIGCYSNDVLSPLC